MDTNKKFEFFLKDDDPREKYRKDFEKEKEVKHLPAEWGQRKLLMTELFLLLNFYPKICEETGEKHLVYVGAGPGNHIPFITEVFKEITFHLYDLKFSFNPFPNTVFYRKFFDDQEAYKWTGKTCIFLSDIRNPEFKKESIYMETMERLVEEDMINQKRWVEIIRPKLFMLKFRLPYYFGEGITKETFDYLDGQILKQPYAKTSSTETRLIGTQNDIKDKEYDIKKYEEQMFFHNRRIRVEYKFENPFTGFEPLWPSELLDDYDSVYEILVLKKLLERLGEEVNERNIKRASRMITIYLNQGKEVKKWNTITKKRNATVSYNKGAVEKKL